ncbi:HesA/MoeB/ThiF family protein [Roseovarius indicus]|uniref:Molybdopterin-synthase adenylyltransferase n=1 Tax=Roseovarius indicus TaxID=540747 RepID=A0A0T5P6R8_9RHOB|nr:HesA/MoeB/ThiF family protein [Roseovarius indicus]KRS16935.1 thiamine biosynthesis protein ThiF [Roseovarius indicus]QEW29589.1 Molybdopterin-synthase adenylyltransferase [Roseovarius indicus]SFE47039.1 Molybdopterin or thiamine biosynthesis adenylyltransferase [Roseovarius indicus]
MSRYARQMVLPEVGAEGQARLARAHVVVVGAGGLGCPVLQYLAGAGVGRITLVDPDTVEESNLHRQPLYRMADLGRPKALAARDHLRAAHPDLRIDPTIRHLDPANAPALVKSADVVVDAADSFAVSYALSDTCLTHAVPLVSASVLGQSGYAGGFCGDAPSLRAVFPDPPGSGATCATAGVMGPVVGALGAVQAQMVLKILLGHSSPSPLGRIVSLDMTTTRLGGFSFVGASEPALSFPFVARQSLSARDRIIELRDEAETPTLPHASARRLVVETLDRVPPALGRRVVLCCATGLRAWRAATKLSGQGHTNLALFVAEAFG